MQPYIYPEEMDKKHEQKNRTQPMDKIKKR